MTGGLMTGGAWPLIRPRSVAIVGCEPLATRKLGSWPLHNLLLHRSLGERSQSRGLAEVSTPPTPPVRIFPVNPALTRVEELPCYPSVAELPGPVDLVLITEPGADLMAVLAQAQQQRAGAAVLFGARSGDARAPGVDRDELAAFCARHPSLRICGPNSNGFANLSERIVCTSAPYASTLDVPAGDVAIVSQSGALLSSLVTRLCQAGLGLSYAVSVGDALDVGFGDCLDLLAQHEQTATILVYAEGVADREGFLDGASRAIAAGKSVIVWKTGRSASGASAVRTHSGALAGSFPMFRALCERHGILVADDVDELVTLAGLVRPRPAGSRPVDGDRLGIVSGSGAIGAILADAAAAHGFTVPALVDLAVHDADRNRAAVLAVAGDPDIDHIVFGNQEGPAVNLDPVKSGMAGAAAAGAHVLAWSAHGAPASQEPILTGARVTVATSTEALLRGLRKVVDRNRRPVDPADDSWRHDRQRIARGAAIITPFQGGPVPHAACRQLLELYQIPVVPQREVDTPDGAVAAADALGYPVVAKLVAPEVLHKSVLGLVELDLRDAAAVRQAVKRLAAAREGIRSGAARVVVQACAARGLEMIISGRVDPEAGPGVLVGFGGVHAELLADVAVSPAPVTAAQAARLTATLRRADALHVGPAAAVDPAPLHAALVRLSQLVVEHSAILTEIEINPIIVSPAGAVAVDVVAIAKEASRAGRPAQPARPD